MTAEHLRECKDCRQIVAEAVRYESLAESLKVPKKHRSPLPAWALVAAALTGIGYVSVSMIRTSRANAPLRALVAATPADGRYLEPRISGGFAWAPLRPTRRGPDDRNPSHMVLVGAAGKVLAQTADDTSSSARHAAAIARLLTGSPASAATQLSRLAQSKPDAQIWSDLAAAYYTEAVQSENPPKLAQALAAADAALRIDAAFPEALFNRALVLEHLGLRDQARVAWNRYLAVDSSSQWAREAEKHIQSLSGVSEFRKELDRTYAAGDNEPAAARNLVRRFPQESRVWGESEILNRWGRQELANDLEGASVHLRMARNLGDELARSSGESLLREAVAVIQQAGVSDRKILAEAHVKFRAAQAMYKAEGPARAEPLFRDAATKFEKGGSPMALVARYFAANTTYDQHRVEEAGAQLEQVLADGHPEFKAHRAQVRWELGMAYAARGRWGAALDSLNQSIDGFESLGEKSYAMTVREIVAEAYERIGEPRKAWNHRVAALEHLGRSDDLRLQVAIYSIARGAAMNQDWPVGLSFVNLQLEMGRHPGDELMYVHTLLLRASIQGRIGLGSTAAEDLTRAAAAIPAIRDVSRRERAESEQLAVEGLLARSPGDAIGALSRAIDFQRTKGRRMVLPELLLHRGRAYVATRQQSQAAEDFEAGIRELEEQRNSIAAGDERWGMFGAADELFDEAVALALERGDTRGALAYSERARARELLDSMGATTVSATTPLSSKVVILEYVQLADSMIIFVLDGERIRVVTQPLSRAVVSQEIDLLTDSVTGRNAAEFRRIAALLYDRLLGPVADELASGSTLVVVPDGTLALVPFAALIDPAGRYVIERRSVVIAPSITVYSGTARAPRLGQESRLLMIAGPTSRHGDLGRLTSEQREIESVAAQYGRNVDYAPSARIAEVLEKRAVRANIIHFVGHAVVPDQEKGGALVTSQQEQLDAREIASMRFSGIGVVVLAACGTARGHGRSGEPSISLARAFLVAGVPSVVATLWPVEDGPAAEFFPQFHRYLLRGLPPADALRAVQLDWIHSHDGSPGVWAAVQIIGT